MTSFWCSKCTFAHPGECKPATALTGAGLTAEDRAAEVERRIMSVLKPENGQPGIRLQHSSYMGTDFDTKICYACAVGSLAVACGIIIGSGELPDTTNRKIKEFLPLSLISPEEVDHLEAGFEGGEEDYSWWVDEINNTSPFYKLGVSLRTMAVVEDNNNDDDDDEDDDDDDDDDI